MRSDDETQRTDWNQEGWEGHERAQVYWVAFETTPDQRLRWLTEAVLFADAARKGKIVLESRATNDDES